jgi:hypothetical protein
VKRARAKLLAGFSAGLQLYFPYGKWLGAQTALYDAQGPANVKPSETQRMFSMQNRSAEVHLNATDDDPGTASQHIFLMDCQEGVSIDCNFVQQMGAEQLLTRNCPFFLKLNTDADSCSVLHMGPK